MSGLFGSITVKGNRLTDMVGQTSAVGRPIPFGYGYCNIDEPNIIWTAGIPKEHVKKKKQGKGGVKTEEYSYTLSYAIAFMAGPVYGFLTIKRGGKVVYTTDPNATVDDKAFAAKWRQKAKLYLGTRTQMPDATIEQYVGAGKVSAFRDLCYIVVVDDDVTAEGGAVPQYEAVIIASAPDVYLTSRPYNYLFDDYSRLTGIKSEKDGFQWTEFTQVNITAPIGKLNETINPYVNWPPEYSRVALSASPGVFRDALTTYSLWPMEYVRMTGLSAPAGTLKEVLITYPYWPREYVASTVSTRGGTLA